MDLDNFIIGKIKEMRGEGRVSKIGSSCLPNTEDRKDGQEKHMKP